MQGILLPPFKKVTILCVYISICVFVSLFGMKCRLVLHVINFGCTKNKEEEKKKIKKETKQCLRGYKGHESQTPQGGW